MTTTEVKRELTISRLNLMLATLYPEKKTFSFQYRYFEILIRALAIEAKFYEQVKAADKEILKYLNCLDDLSPKPTITEVVDKFNELYDTHNKVRFAIETLDSIEEIRLYIKENPKRLLPD